MDDISRQRLGELAADLGDLLDAVDLTTEMECLIHLAEGFVGVLVHEVECARGTADG